MSTAKLAFSLSLVSLAVTPVSAWAEANAETAAQAEEVKRLGSLYLRCDGQPNNIPGMETFGRLVALSLVVGLLLPTPESADPSKRLFGEKGVDSCTQLLEGIDNRENNGLRRVPLMLARALHRIEAKDFTTAIADVELARGEAKALGLIGNAYFDRSMGLSFDLIEAEARLRNGDATGAREVGIRQQARYPYSFYAAVSSRPFEAFNRQLSPGEEQYWKTAQKIIPGYMVRHALRLEEAGRFSEAAEIREGLVTLLKATTVQKENSWSLAGAAVSHALAGNRDRARERADRARANMSALAAAGKPENTQPRVVELLDFHEVIDLMNRGKIDDARRNFAARSIWMEPGLGAVMAVNAKLREGAKAEQLFGSLTMTPDELWVERRGRQMAQLLESDKDNRTLFSFILPYAKISGYEGLSKNVWRTDKPQLISKELAKDTLFYSAYVNGDPMTQQDALLLTSAVQAKARGKPGFVYISFPRSPQEALVQFGSADDPAIASPLYLDADAVITELRDIIPSPADLDIRKKSRR